MTTTATYTIEGQSSRFGPTHERRGHNPGPGNREEDVVATAWEEENVHAYLNRIPQTDDVRPSNPLSLRDLLHRRLDVRSGSQVPGAFASQIDSDRPINILVLELGKPAITTRRFTTVSMLRLYLRDNSLPLDAARRVYLVSLESLLPTVVGLLGSRLALRPEFFATHISSQDLPLSIHLPSVVANRQVTSFDYHRVDGGTMNFSSERITFTVSRHRDISFTGERETGDELL